MAVCGKNTRAVEPENNIISQGQQSSGPGGPVQVQESFNFGNTLSFPLIGNNQKKRLTKGVYKIQGFVESNNGEPVTKSDFTRQFEVDGELKKVRFKRVNISRPETIDGKQLSKLTAVFSIDENPIPIPFIIYGILGATGLGTGGYFISQVSRFTESSFNQFLTLAGIGLTAYFALK